jgi:heme/copper-type cytochrome/quinol oxidase subunit 3
MSAPLPVRVVGDVSALPDHAMGPRNLVWWGNLGFMAIEATAFALAIAAYLYLQSRSPSFPPPGDPMPGLLWSGIFTACMVASILPNFWVSRKAHRSDEAGVRRGMLVMVLIGVVLLVLRGFELAAVQVDWQHDAYGSLVWMLLVLHTSHLVTELGETMVQSVWLFTHEIGPDQFSDVQDNSEYWNFVVIAWLPIFFVLYCLPRL